MGIVLLCRASFVLDTLGSASILTPGVISFFALPMNDSGRRCGLGTAGLNCGDGSVKLIVSMPFAARFMSSSEVNSLGSSFDSSM